MRDSNPRYQKAVYRISSPAHSITLPIFLFRGTKIIIIFRLCKIFSMICFAAVYITVWRIRKKRAGGIRMHDRLFIHLPHCCLHLVLRFLLCRPPHIRYGQKPICPTPMRNTYEDRCPIRVRMRLTLRCLRFLYIYAPYRLKMHNYAEHASRECLFYVHKILRL